VRYTPLSALCHLRESEITDSLGEAACPAWAEDQHAGGEEGRGRVQQGAQAGPRQGGILPRLAEAAVAEPGGTVRKVIYPVAGESTLKALAAEAAASEARYRARVRMVLRSSYSHHWRRMLALLLNALELKCNNTAYWPATDATELLKRYPDQPIAKEGAVFDEAQKIYRGPSAAAARGADPSRHGAGAGDLPLISRNTPVTLGKTTASHTDEHRQPTAEPAKLPPPMRSRTMTSRPLLSQQIKQQNAQQRLPASHELSTFVRASLGTFTYTQTPPSVAS
jgi:hypothetical protein